MGLFIWIFPYYVYASDRDIRAKLDNQYILFPEAKLCWDKISRLLVLLVDIKIFIGVKAKWNSLNNTAVTIKSDKSINVGKEAVISSVRIMVTIRFVSELLAQKELGISERIQL